MKVLITGGAGFVGSHLVDECIAKGYEVIVVDHHKRKKKRFPNALAKTYKMSITDPALRDVFLEEKPDVVCHLAAQISVTYSVDDPIADTQVNIIRSLPLLNYAVESECKKFVFASSGGAIYGDHPILPTPEVFDSMPISPYGVNKQALEHYLESYYKTHGLEYVALRFANIFGPRQLMHGQGEGSVMAIFLAKLLRGESVTIFGDGSSTRDYVYVKDAVNSFVCAMNSDYVGVVNVSTGKETSVKELWEMLKEIHAKEHPMEHAPARLGEIQRSTLDGSYAKEAIAWEPKISIEDGLRDTYAWFMRTFRDE